jgi:phosphinothricin acetyltransferase
VRIRTASEADAGEIAAIYAPFVRDTAISMEETPPSAAEMAERIRACLPTWPWLVAEDEAGVAGYAYASQHRSRPAYRWSVDAAVYVAPRAHRRGVGRALYLALFEILTRQGFHAAWAGVALPNPASVGLHEAVGFEPVGVYREAGFKFGRWWDVAWFRRALAETTGEPIPYAALSPRGGEA